MAKDRVNTSDRKIIETQSGISGTPDFRLPEVEIVGYELRTNPGEGVEVEPGQGGLPDAADIGVPSDIQIENMDVRIQPDGSAVIDIVASYIAADGAKSHEVRVSRL